MTNVDRHQVINKYSSDILLTTFLTLSLVFYRRQLQNSFVTYKNARKLTCKHRFIFSYYF